MPGRCWRWAPASGIGANWHACSSMELLRARAAHLRWKNTRMLVHNRMDAWSVKETFLDRFYSRYGTEIEPYWTIVDIGAAIGEFTVFAAQQAAQRKSSGI